jgi:hypothetical protein
VAPGAQEQHDQRRVDAKDAHPGEELSAGRVLT